ncbi:MAG TPA: Ig-like domain-containing protein, partial [Tidjanibacter sp.]|nr:Ig-like domain-containing protein [Tidjanibacter sp.]
MLMKRMLLFAVLAGIAAGTAGCKQQDAPKLDRQAVRLYVGDQVRITVDRPVAWSAADDFYAAVDADGTVTARHVGTTTVTATADSGSAACTVEVQPRYDTFEEPLYELFG